MRCSSPVRAQFNHKRYITNHNVSSDILRELLQLHGSRQAEFDIWHMNFNVHLLLNLGTFIFFCIIISAWQNIGRNSHTHRHTHPVLSVYMLPNITHTHLDNCAHHVPSGSHHSMCTCNFLGCWCTHGHSHHCIQSRTRLHLQREDTEGCERGPFKASVQLGDLKESC